MASGPALRYCCGRGPDVHWQVWVNLRAGKLTRHDVSVPAGLPRVQTGGWPGLSASGRGEIMAKIAGVVSVFSDPPDESFAAVLVGASLGRLATARQGQPSC